jgi:cobalt-zinc-cadmium efflux system membrane fusion protein
VAVTREAITHEGDTARVWVAVDDQALELRQIKLGRSSGWLVLVPDGGLKPGERVITRGSLFIEVIAVES